MDNLAPKEIADEEMINQAFHELLNDYCLLYTSDAADD